MIIRLVTRRTLSQSRGLLARGGSSGGQKAQPPPPPPKPDKVEDEDVDAKMTLTEKMKQRHEEDKRRNEQLEKEYEEHMKSDEYKERLSIIDQQGFQVMAGLVVALALLQLSTSHYKKEL